MLRKLTFRPFKTYLPLLKRVIFVDWNGVLCHDVFWSSIVNSPKHPDHARIIAFRQWLFGEQRSLVNAWQRGQLTAEDVFATGIKQLGEHWESKDLLKILQEDCRRAKIDTAVLDEILAAKAESYIVLATDNVEPFFAQLDSNPKLRKAFDAVLCSSVLGSLKGEDAASFFGPWLCQHGLKFQEALLVDDSPKICAAFSDLGGASIVFKSIANLKDELREWGSRENRSPLAKSTRSSSAGTHTAT